MADTQESTKSEPVLPAPYEAPVLTPALSQSLVKDQEDSDEDLRDIAEDMAGEGADSFAISPGPNDARVPAT